jgi:hypothetical protein
MERDRLANTPEDIVREARERLRLSSDAESVNRTEAITALNFRNGDQWPVDVKRDRDTDARPCLTINLTDAVVRRVENACRENRPRIKIDPVGDGADVETAKKLNGLTRHVEIVSSADYAYDCAVSSAISGGWGWLSVTNDYVSYDSFDQDLLIVPHRNPFKIYADPASELPDGSDLRWLIESEMMPRTDYRDLYGHLDPGGWNFVGQGDDISDWSNKEQIRVAKYWRIESKPDTLLQLSDGRTMLKSAMPDAEALRHAGLMITRERSTTRKVVRCFLMSAFRVLSEWDWPGKWIPYVPVYGRELDINGKIRRKGMVKDLMDPGRMYNYSETSKTEVYALQPKAPWLVAEGQTDGHEPAWRDANRKPITALPYKPVRLEDGTYAPPPMRQEPPPLAQGFQEWSQSNQSNFLFVAGMPHDPDADKKGEVVSGVAIKRRQGLADVSHFDFYDNLTRSLRQLGRVLVDLYPHFYPPGRVQRIVREDGQSEMIEIPQHVGRYDVTVDTGPSYQTKREETAEALLELVTGAGKIGEMIAVSAADKVLRQFDFPDADGVADRVMSLIPAAQAEKNLQGATTEQLRSLVAGLQQHNQELTQQLQAAGIEIKFKHGIEAMRQKGEDRRLQFKEHAETERTAMELGVKREDVLTKAHTAIHDTHVKATTAMNVAEINVAGKMLDSHLDRAHEREMGERELQHAEKISDADRASSEKIASMKPAPKPGE